MAVLETALLGVCAGALTTVAGMGGGLVLVLALSVIFDPKTALVLTAPALLLGNLHRLVLLRASWQAREWLRIGPAAMLGAGGGGLLTAGLPAALIQGVMVATAGLALVRQLVLPHLSIPSAGASILGALSGLLSATSGGGGVIMGPLLLARGLAGPAYIATGASCAVCIHLVRVGAYTSTGIGGGRELLQGLALAATIAAGNLLGQGLARWIGGGRQRSLQLGVMGLCVLLALLGV